MYPSKSDKYVGVHPYWIEVLKKLYLSAQIGPKDLLINITLNRNGEYNMSAQLPNVKQIRRVTEKFDSDRNELEPVREVLNAIEFNEYAYFQPDFDLHKTFHYGSRLQTGADNSHLFLFFTTKKTTINNFECSAIGFIPFRLYL